MNENTKNLRGFTLVELLAVIVVLAIVMLIAVQAVLPQMEKARRQSFAIEANVAIDAAQAYFMSSSLTGRSDFPANEGGTSCVEISTLYTGGYTELDQGYSGKVVVQKRGNIFLYYVFLEKDNTWMINGAGTDQATNDSTFAGYNGTFNEDIDEEDVYDYKSLTDFATCP